MNKPIKTMEPIVINFKPYHGEFEPITKSIIGKITLTETALEMSVAYDYISKKFDKFDVVREKKDIARNQIYIPKHLISLSRNLVVHECDEQNEVAHIIQIHHNNQSEWVRSNEYEQKEIFNAIKKWLTQPSNQLTAHQTAG